MKNINLQKNIYYSALFFVLISIIGCGGNIIQLDGTPRLYGVSHVVDGNTISLTSVFKVFDGEKHYYIRTVEYIGVEALQTNEPYYEASLECNRYLLGKGKVRLEFDRKMLGGSGKKLLAYVYADNVFVNAEIIRRGYARVDTLEPDIKYAKLLKQLEEEARENRRGIWGYRPDIGLTEPAIEGFVASKSGKSFHRPSCSFASRIDETNKIYFNSFQEAFNSGRKPCKICKPIERLTKDEDDHISEIPKHSLSGDKYEVINIVDGDTVDLLIDGNKVRVRLIGVDTPEAVHPGKPVEYYGKEASYFIENLLKGEKVFIEREPGMTTDKYGRSLFYLYRATDGLFVNLEIVRQGYGYVYTAYPFKYMELFRYYERQARELKKGLWGQEINKGE